LNNEKCPGSACLDFWNDFGGAALVGGRLDLRAAEVPFPQRGDQIGGEVFLVQGEPARNAERLIWAVGLRA
jgi:hypothetical protein